MCRTPVFVFALVIVTAVAAAPSHAAVSLFLYYTGLPGASPTDEEHKDWIIIDSVSIPVQSDQPPTLNGLGPIIGDFVITKQQDAPSVAPAQAALVGTVFAEIKVDIVFPGSTNPNDVNFDGEWTAELAEFVNLGPLPEEPTSETLAINYVKIKYTFTEFDDGGLKSKQTSAWDPANLPPNVSTEGTPDQFLLLNNISVPEPTAALILSPAWLLVSIRRRRA